MVKVRGMKISGDFKRSAFEKLVEFANEKDVTIITFCFAGMDSFYVLYKS